MLTFIQYLRAFYYTLFSLDYLSQVGLLEIIAIDELMLDGYLPWWRLLSTVITGTAGPLPCLDGSLLSPYGTKTKSIFISKGFPAGISQDPKEIPVQPVTS